MLTGQAAVEAVISATTAGEETKQSSTGEESIESEPQAKRQNLGIDFSSLVKEEVFHSQQVLTTSHIAQRYNYCTVACFWLLSIDPFHKWLPIVNSFVLSIMITLTKLLFELIIQKNFYPRMSLLRLIIY